MNEKHTFALYYAPLSQGSTIKKGVQLTITDQQLLHRLVHVLRIAVDDTVIFFDRMFHAQCQIVVISKKQILCTVLAHAEHTYEKPSITVLLPVLKRDALEQALYACVELGATTVQLMTTEKTHKASMSAAEIARLNAIMIAAAEQSKNFALPTLMPPLSMQYALAQYARYDKKILLAVDGAPLLGVLNELYDNPVASVVLTCGPEGDFTAQEYDMLKNHGFVFCRLTPTVLRSYQALIVGLGALRSVG